MTDSAHLRRPTTTKVNPLLSDPGATGSRASQALDAVAHLVEDLLQGFDVVELLTEVSEQCVRMLDIDSVGLLLADPSGRLHLMAATSEHTRHLELLQLQADEGPCLDCYHGGQEVSAPDLSTETGRWPIFAPAATDADFASVHALPLRAAGIALGAIGLFGTTPGELSDADLEIAHALANVAALAIAQDSALQPSTVLPRLRTALDHRTVVEQARGVLRARLDISVAEAFRMLRRYAHANHRPLSDVARELTSARATRDAAIAEITEILAPGDGASQDG